MKIGIISCSSRKYDSAMTVGRLYSKSPLFRYAISYSKKYYDKTFALSAKHGLLHLDTIIEPYDTSLTNIQRRAFKDWIEMVVDQIHQEVPAPAHLYFHAGNRFRKLIPYLPEYQCYSPVAGKGIGTQLQWYLKMLNNGGDPI